MTRISYKRHRFPETVIQHAVWLYFRFTLSFRDVEEMMAHRGVDVRSQIRKRVTRIVSDKLRSDDNLFDFPRIAANVGGVCIRRTPLGA